MALGLSLVLPVPGAAQATAYVPNFDPAYRDLDALMAAGLVRNVIAAQRPYSRLSVARMAVEARTAIASVARMAIEARASVAAAPAVSRLRFVEALQRLEAAFAPEIRALCASAGLACVPLPGGATVRSVSSDFTWADSRGRRIPSSYDALTTDYIDAELNPLLQKNEGRRIADGATYGAEANVDLGLGRFFVAAVHPRAWASAPRGADAGAAATLQEAYVRALLGNFAVDAGRNHGTHGYDREGGVILSNNARGLDRLRFSMDRPASLPSFLRLLGPISASASVADMGGNSDTPHSMLVVFQASARPLPIFEIGATLLNEQGGTGSPAATFSERINDILLIRPHEPSISDKVFGADARLTIPGARTQLYLEVLTTDDHNVIHSPFTGDWKPAFTTEASWTVGATVTGLGAEGRTDLWAEARASGVRPHTHHQFTSGLTLDGRIIGDPLGPLGANVTGGLEWRGAGHTAALTAAWEDYSGADRYEHPPEVVLKGRWIRTVDRPDEVRTRVVADWISDPNERRIGSSVRLGYERVTRFAFTPDSRSNLLVQLKLDYRW